MEELDEMLKARTLERLLCSGGTSSGGMRNIEGTPIKLGAQGASRVAEVFTGKLEHGETCSHFLCQSTRSPDPSVHRTSPLSNHILFTTGEVDIESAFAEDLNFINVHSERIIGKEKRLTGLYLTISACDMP